MMSAAPPPLSSSPLSSSDIAAYEDDSKRKKSVYDESVTPPLHELSLAQRCPALYAVESLIKRNFAVIDDFVQPQEVLALREEIAAYDAAGRMVPGEIGTGVSAGKGTVLTEIRDDVITWLEGSEPFVGKMMKRHILRADVFSQKIQILLDSIKPELSWTGAGRTKIMASLYRAETKNNSSGKRGAKYNPHIDNPNKNGRRLTLLLYLNPGWKPADGGRLRVKTQTEVVDVAPLGGRLVVFWPDHRVPHEVLPAMAGDRYAVTIWYLDAVERKEAERRQAAAAASKE